jgi:hypothetical protein
MKSFRGAQPTRKLGWTDAGLLWSFQRLPQRRRHSDGWIVPRWRGAAHAIGMGEQAAGAVDDEFRAKIEGHVGGAGRGRVWHAAHATLTIGEEGVKAARLTGPSPFLASACRRG